MIRYLGIGDFAKRVGVAPVTLSTGYDKRGTLPPPNAVIDGTRGWLPETIDEWNARRPGKRPRENPDWFVMVHSTIHYLGTVGFAARIGVKADTLNRYKLPLPDAQIGRFRGWLPQTVDEWNARRPGKRTSRDARNWHLPSELR